MGLVQGEMKMNIWISYKLARNFPDTFMEKFKVEKDWYQVWIILCSVPNTKGLEFV